MHPYSQMFRSQAEFLSETTISLLPIVEYQPLRKHSYLPQMNRWTFTCGGRPGINIAKILTNQANDLDGANDPCLDQCGSKMRYCIGVRLFIEVPGTRC